MYCINYVIKPGDSLYSISRQFNISVDMLIAANPLVNVYNLMVDEVICIPVSVPQNNYSFQTTYLVEENDTLGNVLEKHGLNLADLLEFNNLNDIYLLQGTTLQIPVIGEDEDDVVL